MTTVKPEIEGNSNFEIFPSAH